MVKKLLFSFILVLVFSSSALAFVPGVEQAIPQATYRVLMGSEFEYIAKEVQKLDYLFSMTTELGKNFERNVDNSYLMNILMGSDSFVDALQTKDLSSMSKEEIDQFLVTELDKIFVDVHQIALYLNPEMSPSQKNEVDRKTDIITGKDNPVVNELMYRAGEIEKQKINNREEEFQADLNKLNQKRKEFDEYYKGMVAKYGLEDEPLEGSTTDYIQRQKENLQNTRTSFEQNLDKTSLVVAMRTLNMLMLQNNENQIKILEALKDNNYLLLMLNGNSFKENLNNEYRDIRIKYGY